jgi:hypothetical protein
MHSIFVHSAHVRGLNPKFAVSYLQGILDSKSLVSTTMVLRYFYVRYRNFPFKLGMGRNLIAYNKERVLFDRIYFETASGSRNPELFFSLYSEVKEEYPDCCGIITELLTTDSDESYKLQLGQQDLLNYFKQLEGCQLVFDI